MNSHRNNFNCFIKIGHWVEGMALKQELSFRSEDVAGCSRLLRRVSRKSLGCHLQE